MVDTWKRVGGLRLRNGSETQRDETYSKTSRLGVLIKTLSVELVVYTYRGSRVESWRLRGLSM